MNVPDALARKMFLALLVSAKPRNWPRKRLERGELEGNGRTARPPRTDNSPEVEATGVNGAGAPRIPNTTNIYFDYIEGEAAGHRAGFEGTGRLHRRSMFFRRYRAFSCAHRHGLASGTGTG